MPSSNQSRRGVSLLEMTIAMIAASCIISAAGVIYMAALNSFVSAEALTRISSSRTLLDETLNRLSHQCYSKDYESKTDPSGAETILTYVRLKERKAIEPGYPKIDAKPVLPGPGVSPNPMRVTGLIWWYRGQQAGGDPNNPQWIESSVLHIELTQEQWTTCGLPPGHANAERWFMNFTGADVAAWVGVDPNSDDATRRTRRLAAKVLATNVTSFGIRKVIPDGLTGAAGLSWSIEFGNQPL